VNRIAVIGVFVKRKALPHFMWRTGERIFCVHHQVAEIQACAYDDPDGASGVGMWRKVR
jgi:hypothetical protein